MSTDLKINDPTVFVNQMHNLADAAAKKTPENKESGKWISTKNIESGGVVKKDSAFLRVVKQILNALLCGNDLYKHTRIKNVMDSLVDLCQQNEDHLKLDTAQQEVNRLLNNLAGRVREDSKKQQVYCKC